MIINSSRGTNNNVDLLFGTSIYDLKEAQMPPAGDLPQRDGLWLFSPDAAPVRVLETFFTRNPVEARVVLASIRDAADLLRRLLDGGHSVVAGRLAGAFRRIDRPARADEIVTTMKAGGYDVRESDPFASEQAVGPLPVQRRPLSRAYGRCGNRCGLGFLKSFQSNTAGPAGSQGGVPAVRGRNLSERCLSLALHRGIQRLA